MICSEACSVVSRKVEGIPVLYVYMRKRAPSSKVVFLFHKLLFNKEDCLPAAYYLAKQGFYVVCLDMLGHGDRENSYDTLGKYEFNHLISDIYDTAMDVHTVINHMSLNNDNALDLEDVAAVGISAGANIALACGYLHKEIKRVASMIGVVNWDYIIEKQTLNSFHFHASTKIDYENLKRDIVRYNINSLCNYDAANGPKISFFNGLLDTTIPLIEVKRYYKRLHSRFSELERQDNISFHGYPLAGHHLNIPMLSDLAEWLMKG